MKNLFIPLGLTLACLSAVYIVSCGPREDDEVDPVALVSAEPAAGSTIDANGIITVTFDAIPGNVSVNVGVVKKAGITVTIPGPLHPRTTHTDNYVGRWYSNTQLHRRNTHFRGDRANP